MHSKRERPSSLNKHRELFQRSRPSAAAELTETRLLVRAHVAVRGAASAGAVVGGESPQGAVEPAHPALQVVAVGTGEALGLVAVARQAGAVAGVARALGRLVGTAESETRLFKPQSDKNQSRCVCGGERSKNSSFRYDRYLTLGNWTSSAPGEGTVYCRFWSSWCSYCCSPCRIHSWANIPHTGR